MSDPTILPAEVRTKLQQLALDAQAACLAAKATHDAATAALTLNTAMNPHAMSALLRIERGLGIRFAATPVPETQEDTE